VSIVQLSGGEPFTHPSFNKICSFITKNDLKFIVYTSGNVKKNNILNPLSRKILKNLKKTGISKLRFNLQSHERSIHNFLTNAESFDNTIESIKKAIDLGIDCEIHIIPLKQNYKKLKNILYFFSKLKISKVKFLRFVAHGRGLSSMNELRLDQKEYNELINKFIYLKSKFKDFIEIGSAFNETGEKFMPNLCRKCQIGKNKIVITPDSKVYPCVSTKNLKFFDFDLKKSSLKKIVTSNDYKSKVRDFISIRNEEALRCPTQEFIELYREKIGKIVWNKLEKREKYIIS
jgi:MoaA/NifB/PqqE/SkfB family radical SAM enzyme